MADLLDKFIEKAKENLTEGYYKAGIKYEGKGASLRKTIDENSFTLICEIKHASPAGEYSFDCMDVEKAAMEFKENGADAISVVVEPKIFKGDLRNVPVAKKTSLPVLFKDFVISEEQIEAAAAVGADAVLLIVKAAERLHLDLDQLIDCAHHNGLEVLLESYDAGEMGRAAQTNADVLGINNRDLRTLKTDIGLTRRLLEDFEKNDRPVISESGIKNADDVRFVKKLGASGALVGTAIWKAENIGEKIVELKRAALGE